MNNELLWKRFCKYHRFYPEVGFSLDPSRMRFNESIFEDFREQLQQAFDEMQRLEAGEIANLDENRMVGHYWLRAPELAPSEDIREAINASNEKILKFSADIHSGKCKPPQAEKFDSVLQIGIGGSALGPQLVSQALNCKSNPIKFFSIDNTDSDGIRQTLASIGESLASTLVLVVSKSGSTSETRNGSLEVQAAFKAQELDYTKQFVAITGEGSKLSQQATTEGWVEQFAMWDWVGGRTSLFSAVGLLPASLQGIKIDELLKGARKMDCLTRSNSFLDNPAMVLALMWFYVGQGTGKKDMVILPYRDRLELFSKYLQQLVMESLGKELNRDGSTVNQGIAVYGNKGSTDQHAYVQQLRDGLNNFFVTFIEVLNDSFGEQQPETEIFVEDNITSGDYLSGFYQGTRKALYDNGRESITLTVDSLTAESMGALIALYERAVGFYASLININAYHQPGVEAGKRAAAKIIEIQREILTLLKSKSGQTFSIDEIAHHISAPEEAEAIYKILQHLVANSWRGVRRHDSPHPAEASYSMNS